MPRIRMSLVTLVLALACSPADAPPVRDDSIPLEPVVTAPPSDTTAVLSGRGVGCLRIGMRVSDVSVGCTVATDTVVPGPEGTQERELRIGVGPGLLAATVVADTVSRIVVTDPRWRTADSLGVGSELDDLLARDGARAIEGEGRLFVTLPSHCGLSFRLDARRGTFAGPVDELVRTSLQRNTPVDQVIVYGCAP